MSNNTWDFKEQLAIGNAGEQLLMEHYHGVLELHPGRDGDFICSGNGEKVELKTDSYDLNKTSNFFIERYSDLARKSPGSLWQAQQHGCTRFVYMFSQNQTYFEFVDLPKVIETIDRYINGEIDGYAKPGAVHIPNRAWTTVGYKVPRKLLEEHYDEYSWN